MGSSGNGVFDDSMVAELAEAAKKGDVKKVKLLVSKGIDVNARGKDDCTPLIYSLTGANLKGAEQLLELGADPNMQTKVGDSAMSLAANRPDSEALKLMLKHGGEVNLWTDYRDNSKPAPIFNAISSRCPENVRILIEAGANLNMRDHEGWTPLMFAAVLDSYNMMYVLLEAGADLQMKDPMGYTVTWYILDANINPKSEVFQARKKCMDFMEKKGINWEQEKVKNAEIARRIEEKIERGEVQIP